VKVGHSRNAVMRARPDRLVRHMNVSRLIDELRGQVPGWYIISGQSKSLSVWWDGSVVRVAPYESELYGVVYADKIERVTQCATIDV